MTTRKECFDTYGKWPTSGELAEFRQGCSTPRVGVYDMAAFLSRLDSLPYTLTTNPVQPKPPLPKKTPFIGNPNNPKDGMVKVKLDRQQVFVSEGASFTIPAHTECMVPVAVAKKIKEQEDLYTELGDINSELFNPLEYKRLTGKLPQAALDAAAKLKLL